MLAVNLSLRFANGARSCQQMLAPSTSAAIVAAQDFFGDQLRGASASVLALRAPGLVISPAMAAGLPREAANDGNFAGVWA